MIKFYFICRYTVYHDDICVTRIYIFCGKYSFSVGLHYNDLMYPNPSCLPPQNKNDWVHSVIFEPQLKIQLTRSSYKITSFLDFQPFLQGFQSVDKYINDLITDMNDPTYFWKLIAPFHDVQVTPLSTDNSYKEIPYFSCMPYLPPCMSSKDEV